MVLFEHAQARQTQQFKVLAKLLGHGSAPEEKKQPVYSGDPASVAHLSEEEREQMTRELMASYMNRARQTPLRG